PHRLVPAATVAIAAKRALRRLLEVLTNGGLYGWCLPNSGAVESSVCRCPDEPRNCFALDMRQPLVPGVDREHGAEEEREDAAPQELLLAERAIGIEERRAARRVEEAPEERQVDPGIAAADVAPVDHRAERAVGVDEDMAE